MRDDCANQRGKPCSITLYNALGDHELTILAILGNGLEEGTYSVGFGQAGV